MEVEQATFNTEKKNQMVFQQWVNECVGVYKGSMGMFVSVIILYLTYKILQLNK